MKNWQEIVAQNTLRYLDHTQNEQFISDDYTAMTSFAIDDALAISVGEKLSPPTIRLWVHDQTVVLGIPDTRLPYMEESVTFLKNNGLHVVVRNSGGLAVTLDKGVLNMSLIIPNDRSVSIQDGYEAMLRFIQYILQDYTDAIKAYEIVGSYCPGDYDLSIHGIKFAGISQRRVRNGIAIQIYLDVAGNSQKNAELIRDFYQIGVKGEKTSYQYPTIDPQVMGSLSELLNQHISVKEMIRRIETTLKQWSKEVDTTELTNDELVLFKKRFEQMVKRNEKIK